MSIWQSAGGAQYIGPMRLKMVRVVESQEEIATLSLVDSLEEQQVLEQLLEDTKPGKIAPQLHYLLTTPFRYPPLSWGSRFGRIYERALFYASLSIETALTESAFYRLLFIDGVTQPFPKPVVSQHTSFCVNALSEHAVDLTRAPYDKHMTDLRAQNRYDACQQLGQEMREAGIELFIYLSARDRAPNAINAAAFVPKVFGKSTPGEFQSWTCFATADAVRYISTPSKESFEFNKSIFTVDGKLPMPPTP